MKASTVLILSLLGEAALGQAADLPSFRHVTIDDKVSIGYGIAIADMNADKKPDIVLCDASNIAWYQNPSWKKHIIVENLTQRDHVCIAVRDIDGDGRAEIAAGAHDLSPMASERSSNPRFTWTRLDDDISTWSESSRPGKSVPRKMPATTVGAWSA